MIFIIPCSTTTTTRGRGPVMPTSVVLSLVPVVFNPSMDPLMDGYVSFRGTRVAAAVVSVGVQVQCLGAGLGTERERSDRMDPLMDGGGPLRASRASPPPRRLLPSNFCAYHVSQGLGKGDKAHWTLENEEHCETAARRSIHRNSSQRPPRLPGCQAPGLMAGSFFPTVSPLAIISGLVGG